MDSSTTSNKERLLCRIRELIPKVLDGGLLVKADAEGRCVLSGHVDIREATRLRMAVHLFKQDTPEIEVLMKKLEYDIPQVRLGDVTNPFERQVLSEVSDGNKRQMYLKPSKLIDLPEWNTDFVVASDCRSLRAIAPRYCLDDAAMVEQVARFVADFCNGIVVHTGAGISSNAGIATYREGSSKSIPISAAMPTYAHYALVALVQAGKVDYICSQNVDGLHRRSGLPAECLSELHGNSYIETCSCCNTPKEFLRPFCVHEVKDRNPKYWAKYVRAHGESQIETNADLIENERASGIHHITGRACPYGGGPLRDSVIHFGEDPSKTVLQEALCRSRAAPLNLVLGTSLLVEPACDLPFKSVGPVVIVSKTCTGGDGLALNSGGMLLRADVDFFMEHLMRHSGFNIPNTSMQLDKFTASVRARDEAVLKSLDSDLCIPNAERMAKNTLAKQSATEKAERRTQQEEARQKALSQRPEFDVPTPKEIKEVLLKLQRCTSGDFQKKHGFAGASGNKLAKTKYGCFQSIFAEFVETATLQELHQYKGT